MSTFLNKIIYLSQTDYDTLAAGTSVTHGGVTLTGLEDDIIYLTDGTITSDDLGSYVISTTNGGTGLSSIGTSGQVLKVNSAGTGLEWGSSGGAGTVTSVQVQATSPVQSSTSTEQTSTLNTTISLASAYGDTQNPYGSKTANYILAAPNGSAGAPTFRALVADDLPTIPTSKGGTGLTTLGTAGQVLKVNNGATALEWGAAGEATQIVQVAGTDPVITGVANTRYICGTVSTISITPPQSGIIDVIFTSGSSVAVVTLPNTVKMPEWYEIETDRVYEINIMDGIYGSVMSWPI